MKTNFRTRSEARVFCKLHNIASKAIVGPTSDSLPWSVSSEEPSFVVGKTYRISDNSGDYRVGLLSISEDILCLFKDRQYFTFVGKTSNTHIQIHESSVSRFSVVEGAAEDQKLVVLSKWNQLRDEMETVDKQVESLVVYVNRELNDIQRQRKSIYRRLESLFH